MRGRAVVGNSRSTVTVSGGVMDVLYVQYIPISASSPQTRPALECEPLQS